MEQAETLDAGTVSLHNNALQLRETVFADALVETFGRQDVLHRFDNHYGAGAVEFVEVNEGFNIILSRCFWKQSGQLSYRGEDWVRFNFALHSNATFVFHGAEAYELKGQELRVFYQPSGMSCDHLIHPDALSRCVTISLRREYLARRMQELPELRQTVLARLQDPDEPFFLARFRQTAQTLRIIHEVLEQPYRGELRQRYIRAKSEELLCAAFHAMLRPESPAPGLRMTGRDWRGIDAAKELLDEDIARAPSMQELSRRVGLNRNKLSFGFRQRFHTTVGRYIAAQRLERAWDLLEAQETPVSQIAESVGYQHPANFSAAFRQHFGIAPSEVRLTRPRK